MADPSPSCNIWISRSASTTGLFSISQPHPGAVLSSSPPPRTVRSHPAIEISVLTVLTRTIALTLITASCRTTLALHDRTPRCLWVWGMFVAAAAPPLADSSHIGPAQASKELPSLVKVRLIRCANFFISFCGYNLFQSRPCEDLALTTLGC